MKTILITLALSIVLIGGILVYKGHQEKLRAEREGKEWMETQKYFDDSPPADKQVEENSDSLTFTLGEAVDLEDEEEENEEGEVNAEVASNLITSTIVDPDGYSNVRSGPGTKFSVVTKVDAGERVSFDPDESGNWVKVITPNNEAGWVHKSRIDYYNDQATAKNSSSQTGPEANFLLEMIQGSIESAIFKTACAYDRCGKEFNPSYGICSDGTRANRAKDKYGTFCSMACYNKH
jgi:hypothetical protein